MSDQNQPDLVVLDGPPETVGRTFGALNAGEIRGQVAAFFQETDRDRALRATGFYRETIGRYAPYLLDEAVGMAESAGVDAEDYIAWQGAKYRGVNRDDCFTWYAGPSHCAGGATLFHKNRDNKHRPQAAYVKGLRVADRTVYRLLGGGDNTDLAVTAGVNEKGLAGAADMGPKDPNPRFCGVMNGDLLRLVLDQSADVDEAREWLLRFHKEKTYAGGEKGTLWMFADSRGHALRVEQFHETMTETRREDGFLTMRDADERADVVLAGLREADGDSAPAGSRRLSRGKPVLQGNVCCMTAMVPPADVETFGWAEFALFSAERTVYAPLYLGVTATPRVLADGTLYRRSIALAEPLGEEAERFEAELDLDRARLESVARRLAGVAGPDAARQALTQGCAQLANRAAAFLAGSGPE